MTEHQPAERAAPEPLLPDTWSVKEVVADLKSDIIHRFDKTDSTLEAIDRRLDNAATREDVSQLHRRIDGLESTVDDRLVPLEQQAADEKAIEQSRGRFRTSLAWGAGLVAAAGVAIAAVIGILSAVH